LVGLKPDLSSFAIGPREARVMPRAIVGGITRKLEKPQLAERSAVPPITDSAADYEAVIRLVRSARDLFHRADRKVRTTTLVFRHDDA
jgi:hypothetical protein